MAAVVLAVALVAYNNLQPDLQGMAYVGVNLAIGVALVAIAIGALGSNPGELGLTGNRPWIVAAAAGATVALTAPLFAFALFEPTAHLLADRRVAELGTGAVAFQAVVRIPVGTAFVEELAFRGVLFGLFSRHGVLFGAIASSIAFGLWHIRPAADLIQINVPDASPVLVALFVLGAVLVTAIAGLAFSWLRVVGGGIWAPVAFHAGVNSLALLAAMVAHAHVRA